MSFGDYVYIVAVILFAYMTFVIIRNNFRSKFDAQERRKDLADEYEEDYIVDEQQESKED
ncbi:hypothetical protein MNB_SV-10-810 [hydrothermal vent metagenome]|uniref:Uncharacterized protein n=1 Tax=hydrothermal vent metagenome TaxID=652676 RepID=A0A1W1CKG5_9ZZZZ